MIIVIMGMHRSGTSLMGHLLSDAGFKIENNLLPQPENPNGYFEDIDVQIKNNRILSFHGGTWSNPPDIMIRKTYEFDNDCDAVKDPRFVLTYPAWVFGPHKVIKMERKPESIVKSLMKREGWIAERCLRLCKVYKERMRNYDGFTVQYEDLLEGRFTRLEEFIGKKLNSKIIDKSLNHG